MFFDQSEACRAPLFELLERAGAANKVSLVARAALGEGPAGLAQASTGSEWRVRGALLFKAQRWEAAAHVSLHLWGPCCHFGRRY